MHVLCSSSSSGGGGWVVVVVVVVVVVIAVVVVVVVLFLHKDDFLTVDLLPLTSSPLLTFFSLPLPSPPSPLELTAVSAIWSWLIARLDATLTRISGTLLTMSFKLSS